jgi:DnaJ family protein A protein 5
VFEMGAQQSTGNGGAGAGAGAVDGDIKTSYYELLGIERTATDEECAT